MTNRGFTLVELLVALVIGTVVLGGAYRTLTSSQQTSRALTQRIDVQQNLRAGVQYLAAMLRELNSADGDLVVADDTEIEFRSMYWTGVLCDDPVPNGITAVDLPIRRSVLFGVRDPDAALDSILLFREGDPNIRTDDRWLAGGLTGAQAGTCDDGAPANLLTVVINAASGGADSALTGVLSGAPLRGFQMEELSLYQASGGRWWLGRRMADCGGAWSGMQTVAGPLTGSGLRLQYFDGDGNPTADRLQVASVGLSVRAESRETARLSTGSIGHVRDSLVTRVALRNNPRF